MVILTGSPPLYLTWVRPNHKAMNNKRNKTELATHGFVPKCQGSSPITDWGCWDYRLPDHHCSTHGWTAGLLLGLRLFPLLDFLQTLLPVEQVTKDTKGWSQGVKEPMIQYRLYSVATNPQSTKQDLQKKKQFRKILHFCLTMSDPFAIHFQETLRIPGPGLKGIHAQLNHQTTLWVCVTVVFLS